MCSCVGVAIGSYDNTVLLGRHPCMEDYLAKRVKDGLSGTGIPVDRCIMYQVLHLWENGVRTYGSCCGHNKVPGFINVDPKDFDKAIELGYEKYEFANDHNRNDTVKTLEE